MVSIYPFFLLEGFGKVWKEFVKSGDFMLVSMTGFGRSKKDKGEYSVIVEVRSVNHRFFDCHLRLPIQLGRLEDKIKKQLNRHLKRGRIDCFVTVEGSVLTKKQLHIDWNLLDEYYQFITELKKRYNFTGNIELANFLGKNDLISVLEVEDGEEDLEILILEAADEAAKECLKMRREEGEKLTGALEQFLNQLEEEIERVEIYAPDVIKQYVKRLEKRMKELLDGGIDNDRILAEVAVMAERSDISEEITRLYSHISQFRASLSSDEPIGRKLDFIVQEMNREANTIGSKANNGDISRSVVQMKTIIEKIKEQVQNIE